MMKSACRGLKREGFVPDHVLTQSELACPCGCNDFRTVHEYDAPPGGETRFAFSDSGEYRRRLDRCSSCGHFVSVAAMPLDDMYRGDYVNATYGGGGLIGAFRRITGLAPELSDNAGRVQRVCEFAASRLPMRIAAAGAPSVCDVGSGLCVFLWGMKAAGWRCLAIDPDPRAAEHARTVVGVGAICADFREFDRSGRHVGHEVITLNKVLEHVPQPAEMLALAMPLLARDGFGDQQFAILLQNLQHTLDVLQCVVNVKGNSQAIVPTRENDTTLREFLH